MISMDFFVYIFIQLLILGINLLGYSKIPILGFFGIIGTLIFAVPTFFSFGDYYMVAVFLILINISLPIIGLTKAFR